MISRATYCTREDVNNVMGVTQSSRAYPAIDRAIETATRNIDKRCHRTFHPSIDTREFLWPDPNSSARSWRVWLDDNELVSATTVTSGGTVIGSDGYYLEPQASGPPYNRIETNLGSSSAFSSGPATQQRALSILGLYGYDDITRAVTTLAGALASVGGSLLTVAEGSQIGVGDLVKIGSERLVVTGRSWATTGQSLLTPVTASAASVSLAVTDGSAFGAGETLTLDSEQVLIVDVIANTLVVQRAVNATVLAAHTGSTIYAPRTLMVQRAANGTAAATHAAAATVSRQIVPAPVHSLAVAESIVELQQADSGYARLAGTFESARVIGPGPGLNDLRDMVVGGYQRRARTRAV